MGLRALTRGNRHLCRQTNSQIASHSSFRCTRNVTCSFNKGKEFHYINTNSGHMVQSHLVRMKFRKFLPLGVRELSFLGENKVQIRTEEDSKEKEEAQAKEKVNRKHLQIVLRKVLIILAGQNSDFECTTFSLLPFKFQICHLLSVITCTSLICYAFLSFYFFSIGREKSGIDFHSWKEKFMSSVRHYWYGTKLLWLTQGYRQIYYLNLSKEKNFLEESRDSLLIPHLTY